jgi:RNA polymerase sigma-70 factor (ECF subfamily)
MNEDLTLLLNRLASGDENAFRKIFEQFSPKVYLYALKLTRSRIIAEEIVQDVFLKIWDARSQLNVIAHFPSYLYVVTRNRCFNALKRLATEERVKNTIIKTHTHSHTDTEEAVIYKDYQHHLHEIVDQLPPQQKMVYSLCHGEGLKYEEAAERMKISRFTVKTHMQQALRTIKSQFGSLLSLAITSLFC